MRELPVELFVSIIGVLLAFTGSVSAFLLKKIDAKLDIALTTGVENSKEIAVLRIEMCNKQDKRDCYAFHKDLLND